MSLLDTLRGRRRAHLLDEAEVDTLTLAWERAVLGAGFVRSVATVTGPTIIPPRIVHLVLGPPAVLTVRLEPGQTVGDLRALAGRLAPHLGAALLRVEPIGLGDHARVTLLAADPLAAPVPRARPVASALHPLTLGHGEDGRPVPLDLAATTHIIAQGASGSGKSTAAYSLLGQLGAARDVRVTGCDPTRLLLGPWAGRWADVPPPALGTTDPNAHVATLAALVAEMDRRVATIPAGYDAVRLGAPGCPLLLAVLEEFGGLLRLLDATDPKTGKLARSLVARLLGEGRKAGVRVLLLVQRADANLIGGYERGQASHRISFRVDGADAVKMLHPDVPAEVVAEHATAPPGIALLSAPGVPLLRLRGPLTTYAEYVAAVAPGPAQDGLSGVVAA